MRTFLTALLLSACLPLFAQNSAKVQLLLSQIGKTLDKHEVAATAQFEETGIWEWQFLMVEEGLRADLQASLAQQLTSFTISYDATNYNYRGKIQQAKNGTGQLETLSMIFFQLQLNIIRYGNKLDVINLDEKQYYLLYFPHNPKKKDF